MRIGVDYRVLSVGKEQITRGLGRYTQQQLRAVLDVDGTNEYVLLCTSRSDLSLIDPAVRSKANEKVGKGSVVTLTVSSGREQVNVPSLFNVPESEAAADLRNLGFKVERTTSTDASVASGRVIRTDPGASTPLAKGSTVTLIVSTGAPVTTSPVTTAPPSSTTTTTKP